ncbi:hypothetical protein FKO01_47405 [Mesorhizobium sp. B2-3-3]|nr:hypothetical protein FKO01_47405 [Mesorhizobium sp. B2-3-3]
MTPRPGAGGRAAPEEVRLVSPLAKTYGPYERTTTRASHTARSATATAWKPAPRRPAPHFAACQRPRVPISR